MRERIAILVIHGIGQQRPYQTLDNFTRHLMESLQGEDAQPWTVTPQLDRPGDPTHASRAWTRVSFRLEPPAGTHPRLLTEPETEIEEISLFEYYWAPITADKISYISSLLFLIRAGLQPFLYLASNLNALNSVDRKRRFLWIVLKELWRQASLFLPLLLLLISLLWSLSLYPQIGRLQNLHLTLSVTFGLFVLAARYLYLLSSARAFKSSLGLKSGWQAHWAWRLLMGAATMLHLCAWPFAVSALIWVAHRWHFTFAGARRMHAAFDPFRFPSHAGWREWIVSFLLLDRRLQQVISLLITLLLLWVARLILVNYVGDIAVYVNASELARSYAARAQILEECTSTLGALLIERSDGEAPGPKYDRVLIAAHSLGTVIAYDALNQLLNRARTAPGRGEPEVLGPGDLARLRGLITFGSPMNKIFYFFREQGDPSQTLRRQTLDLLYGFRLAPEVSGDPRVPPFQASNDPRWAEASAALERGFRWINAYCPLDPISGRIAFYRCDGQRLFWYAPFVAHVRYWQDKELYTFFREWML